MFGIFKSNRFYIELFVHRLLLRNYAKRLEDAIERVKLNIGIANKEFWPKLNFKIGPDIVSV